MIVHRSDEEDYKKESRLISRLHVAYSVCFTIPFFSKSRFKSMRIHKLEKECFSAAKDDAQISVNVIFF